MNRIEKRFQDLQQKNEKAMITYITAGLPDMKKTVDLVVAQEEAGVDIVEIGIPFSDPIADGPVIQDASYRSIQNGTNVKGAFEAVKEIRQKSQVPIVFMLYYNTILHMGVEEFVKKCMDSGVDGLIVPDLPYEEQFEIKEILDQYEEAPILIELIAPTTKDRIKKIEKEARGFLYCVSSMGVTGQKNSFYNGINHYLSDVKKASHIPVVLGFGIRSAEDVKEQRDIVDGFVIGTAFIQKMEESGYDLEVAKTYIRDFKEGISLK